MKHALIVETSTPEGGLALIRSTDNFKSKELLAHRNWDSNTPHSEIVTQAAKDILRENHLDISNIQVFGAGIGPGSFTGIRVGLNMMRAFAYSGECPLLTFSSLKALALSAPIQALPIITLVNAHKNMVYGARFSWTPEHALLEEIPPAAFSLHQLPLLFKGVDGPALVLGNAFEAYQSLIPQDLLPLMIRKSDFPTGPQVQTFALLLDFASASLEQNHWKSAKPLYIRASEAEEKLKMGLLKPLTKI